MAQSCGIDKHHDLLFGRWVKKVARHADTVLGSRKGVKPLTNSPLTNGFSRTIPLSGIAVSQACAMEVKRLKAPRARMLTRSSSSFAQTDRRASVQLSKSSHTRGSHFRVSGIMQRIEFSSPAYYKVGEIVNRASVLLHDTRDWALESLIRQVRPRLQLKRMKPLLRLVEPYHDAGEVAQHARDTGSDGCARVLGRERGWVERRSGIRNLCSA